MSGFKYVSALVLVFTLLGFLVYYDGTSFAPSSFLEGFIKESIEFSDGSKLSYLLPDKPTSQDSKPVDIQYEEKQVKDQNGTSKIIKVPIQSQTTQQIAVEGIPQYSKSDPNGVVVQGYIILKDSVTGKPIKPYIYNVMIQIQCDEEKNNVSGSSTCGADPVFGRIMTEDGGVDKEGNDNGGYFVYKWHPSGKVTFSFYEVKIIVISDQKNEYGRYENYEQSYVVEVIP